MSKSAYPLSWPMGWPRTAPVQRRSAKFNRRDSSAVYARKRDLTVADGVTRVLSELQAMGVAQNDIIVSTNIQPRLDGFPRSNLPDPSDPGVAGYWHDPFGGEVKDRVMAIDRYDRVADNLAAIAATLNAMRAIERHGGSRILQPAFTGFTALPAPGQTSGPGWRQVFGFEADEDVPLIRLEGAYRTARSEAHPDRPGGSTPLGPCRSQSY